MPKVIDIRYKKGGRAYALPYKEDNLKLGQKILVESSRGLELVEVVRLPYECTTLAEDTAKFVRVANGEDIKKHKELESKKKSVWKTSTEIIEKYKLNMKLVDIEFTMDNSKAIISFVCEERVDFRELVKDLASVLKQRIELRQIGIRDQAKIVGGIGPCGKECCCKQYLNDFDKVSIKMAKTQGLSLNPTKISGICGRLMCCLSYENEFYSEISKKMPKLNSAVNTPDGEGQVIYNNLLKQTVTVKMQKDNDIKIQEYPVDSITIAKRKNDK